MRPHPVRRFGPCTAALDALADWLIAGGVTTVARASTGVSWMPWFARGEARGVQGLLSDPRPATRVPGRPHTARLDGTWLQRLPTYGLLAAACRPADQICVLRSALRHRQMLRTSGAHHIPHMPKALPQMHRTRSQGVSDLPGVTGRAILNALIAGERPPLTLAKRRNPPCQHSEAALAKALQGPWRAAHLCALQHAVALSPCSHQQRPGCAPHLQAPRGPCAAHRAGQP